MKISVPDGSELTKFFRSGIWRPRLLRSPSSIRMAICAPAGRTGTREATWEFLLETRTEMLCVVKVWGVFDSRLMRACVGAGPSCAERSGAMKRTAAKRYFVILNSFHLFRRGVIRAVAIYWL